jgi:hypothetical protein
VLKCLSKDPKERPSLEAIKNLFKKKRKGSDDIGYI